MGVQYDRREKLRYNVRGKKSIPVTTNGAVLFNIKGRFDVDKEFKQVLHFPFSSMNLVITHRGG